jgi:NAD+ kinase
VNIGLVVHAGRPESIDAARQAGARLASRGADVRVAGDESGATISGVATVPADEFAPGLDVAVSLGGDGTFLRAAHLCRDSGVPVLGVNLGRLGFLAEVERDRLDASLDGVARGEFEVEERGTLDVEVTDGSGVVVERGWALNEVSIEKSARQRLLLLDVYVGGSLFARVPADALIVATPTGSTAYALSAGGPIVSPNVRATLVTPVAPHSLFDRTLVAGVDEAIEVRVLADQAPAVVSCDGRAPVTVAAGGSVRAIGGGAPVRVARVAPHDFYGLVRRKFGLR